MEVEKINEFQEEITRQLMIINSKLTQHATSAGSNYKLEECMKMLPLKSVEEINNFESFVIENKLEDLVAKELSGIGGENCKILTKRIMYRMVSNTAGQYYSMEGAKGKNVFKTLTLFAIIRKAVRLNPRTAGSTDDQVIETVKSWLAQAKNRLKYKRIDD